MRWQTVLLLVLLVVVSLGAGLRHLRTSLIEQGRLQERQQAKDDTDQLMREASRVGGQMAALARADATAAREHAAKLQRELRHGRQEQPLLVAAPGLVQLASSGDCHAARANLALPLEMAASSAGSSSPAAPSAAPGRGLRLSAGAVRMWNSALAGADVSQGACGPDDPAAAACALASAFDIDDAFSNHVENAARCREDRARHQRLIDYLQRP
ncbi:MAG: hypothetical protein Q8R98_17795 [Rubrivivax sp.]|nr:hypothetical protein [Rubrivivax sp.]MDP3224385.1 hypothetical protein [Rubrivivax sp.]MDP3613695.1 hypothetical protein [Rubrivivax sp.]